MNHFTYDILNKILNQIHLKTHIKYIPYGDGEQNYTIFYKKKYPYNQVNREWNIYYNMNYNIKSNL